MSKAKPYEREPNGKIRPRTEEDRKKGREYARLWRQRNPEKHREINRRYLAKHPETKQKWEANNRTRRAQQDKERFANETSERRSVRNARKNDYYERNKGRILEAKCLREYGITLAQRKELLDQQGGVCAICLGANLRWCVDHCHGYEQRTGGIKIRGILCSDCNVMLGLAKDSVERLTNAIKYLEKHR